jgi:pilus assembly protein CpaE
MVLRTMQPHQAGIMLLHGCPKFKGIDLIKPAIMEKVWIKLSPLYEWIIVDLGHWLDEVFFATAKKADRLILLTGQTIPDLHNLRDLLMLFLHRGLKTEKINVIINRYQKGKSVDLKELESIQHQPVFFTLPEDDKSLRDSINHGIPLAEMSPRSKLYRSLRSLAQELIHSREAVTGAASTAPPKARRWFLFF